MTEQEQTTNNEYRLSRIFTPVEQMEIVAILAGVSIEEMIEIVEKELNLKNSTQQGNVGE
jgi:hypothetical protein